MSLSELDFTAIVKGTAHTPECDTGCTPLIKISVDRLREVMAKPTIAASYRSRMRDACINVREMIANGAENSEIIRSFLLIRGKHLPFEKFIQAIRIGSLTKIKNIGYSEFGKDEIDRIDAEIDVLIGTRRSLQTPHLYGGGGADIVSMNATMGLMTNNERKSEQYIPYIEVIISSILLDLENHGKSPEGIELSDSYVKEKENWMKEVFGNSQNSFKYIVEDFRNTGTTPTYSKALVDTVLCLLPLHIRRADDNHIVYTYLKINNGSLEISGQYSPEEGYPIERASDLQYHSYSPSVDGSFFLQWMIDTFGNLVAFRVEGDKIIFSLKPL